MEAPASAPASSRIPAFLKSEMAQFILKTTVFFVLWYIGYEMLVGPDGRVDEWLSLNVVANAAAIVRWVEPVWVHGRVLGLPEAPGILLVDGCNGIAAMGLFFGFLIGYPGRTIPKLLYGLIGVLLLYVVNIVRIVALVFTQKYYPDVFAFTHDYSTTFIFYLVIFVLWVVWSEIQHRFE